MDDFIEHRDIIWLSAPARYMAKVANELKTFTAEALLHELPDPIPHTKDSLAKLSKTLQRAGRNYYEREYRISGSTDGFYNLFQPDLAARAAGNHHPAFDLLMYSLGGGKAENIAYLERWILTRYNQIEAGVEDATFPALVFLNKTGGAGKGLLTERVLVAMFGANGVLPNARMDDITGTFNSAILNKVVVHINEAAMEQTNSAELKRTLGSPTLMVNAKYLAAFPIPNIMAVIISGNDRSSVVKLTGSKIDRRFSVIRTDLEWDTVLADYVANELPSATDGYTADDIKVYTKELVQKVFTDRDQVGRWLAYLDTKHPGDNLHIGEHHGTDYVAATSQQQTLVDRLIARIFDDSEFDCIDWKSVRLAYDTNFKLEGSGVQRRQLQRLREDFEEAARKRGLIVTEGRDTHRNKTIFFAAPGYDTASFDENKFVTFEGNGNKISNIMVN